MEAIDDAGREQVDEQLSAWRQGDCVIGEHWFLFRTNSECPLTGNAVAAVTEGAENAETAVRGFAVLTQTCDLVRPCVARPFVEVSPLVEVDDFGHGLVGLRNLGTSGWNAGYADIGAGRPSIMAHGPRQEDGRPGASRPVGVTLRSKGSSGRNLTPRQPSTGYIGWGARLAGRRSAGQRGPNGRTASRGYG